MGRVFLTQHPGRRKARAGNGDDIVSSRAAVGSDGTALGSPREAI